MSEKIKGNIPPLATSAHVVIGAQSNDHSAHLAGVSTKQFFTDADTFARVQLLVTEYYRLDVLSNFGDVYIIEAEASADIPYPIIWRTFISKSRKERALQNLCEKKGNRSTFNGNHRIRMLLTI
ncbi:MAG: hypothetical protein P8X90_13715 [Desulfobacterales bacterium]|jgi:uroporphyrinogen-III decarboxylase